jgi:hypothetical protein
MLELNLYGLVIPIFVTSPGNYLWNSGKVFALVWKKRRVA